MNTATASTSLPIDNDHQNVFIHMDTVDFVLYIVVSSICCLLCIWWIYVLYFSRNCYEEEQLSPDSSNKSQQSDPPPTSSTSQIDVSNIPDKPSDLKKKSSSTKPPSISQFPKALCTLSIFCSSTYLLIGSIMWIMYPNADSVKPSENSVSGTSDIHCVITTLNLSVVGVSRWFLYFYYVERIRIIFNGSLFELTKLKYRSIIVCISVGHVFSALFYTTIQITNMCSWNVLLTALSFPLLNDFTVAIFCLCYFVYKFVRLFKYTSSIAPVKATVSMKYAMRRIILLSTITIVTQILSVIMVSFGFFTIIAINELVNIMCLILSFAFVDYYYRKICCVCLLCVNYCDFCV